MNTLPGVWLDDLTRQELAARFDGNTVALVPIVSAGPPGPHLPLKAAALIARALCQQLFERLDLVVAPVVDADSYARRETLGQVVLDHLERLRELGARRIALLEISASPLGIFDAAPEVVVLRAGERMADDEYVTSCVMALDPRSVRMPLLPAGSRAQAFDGERGMACEVDTIAGALAAKWSDLR